jgi:hypothetical protein
MTKKILLIIGILAIVSIALFLIFSSKPQLEEGESRVGFSIRDYLPFGKSDDSETNSTTTETNDGNPPAGGSADNLQNTSASQPVPRLRKISSEPVAGAIIFNTGTTSIVRFVEKGTGNVYEIKSDSVAVQRLTNTTIPKIIRAFWLPNGSGFLAQTLEPESEITETSFVKLKKNTASTTNEILTPFSTTIGKLPTGIKEIAIKPDGAKIFYYIVDGSFSKWFISNPDGTGAASVFFHSLTEWTPKWTSSNTIIMQTKKSFETISYNYSFDISNKILKKTGTNETGISTKTNTLAEKCVELKDKNPTVYCAVPSYLPSGNYPDVWYKGLVSTEDFIEKIDLANDVYYNIADLSDISGEKIDVVDMSISPDENHLIFRNKIDGYLWMLRIGE